MSSEVACQGVALCEGLETSLEVASLWDIRDSKRFDSLTSRSLSLRPSRPSRGVPATRFSTAVGMTKITPKELPFLQQIADAIDCVQVNVMRSAAH